MAVPLLSIAAPSKRLIADKAYDADSLRRWLKARRIKAVIPSTATRTVPYPLDRSAYRRRNVIERLFCRLKNWRRLATRYDRLARNYLAALALVALVSEWTR
jgi:transposase